MRYNYIFVVLLFLCGACKEKTDTAINSFDVVEEVLDYDSVYSDKNDPLGTITDMQIIDNVLITKHMGDRLCFSFIDVNSGNMLRRWGCKGQAPNEFIDFGSDFTIFESQIVFLSKMKKEINYVLISDILEDKDTLSVCKAPYPYTAEFRPSRLKIVKDKKIVLGSFKDGRFGVLDSTNRITGYASEYPFDCGEVVDIYRGSIYQGEVESNNKQGKFVIATFSSDIFEIYQISDSAIYRTYTNSFNYVPQICKKGDRYALDFDRNIVGLMNLEVSDAYICFLYSPQTYNEADGSRGSNEILCFDWTGMKIKKYILPFQINNFCIDKDFIYGVRYYNDETIFYRFKL